MADPLSISARLLDALNRCPACGIAEVVKLTQSFLHPPMVCML